MSIDFPCDRCGKLIRAGDDSAGTRARCPFCQEVLVVPIPLEEDIPTLSPVEPPAAKKAEPEKSSPERASPEKIHVACEHCHKKVRVPTTSIGRKIRCPHCREPFRVVAGSPPAERPSSTVEKKVEEPPQQPVKPKLKLTLPTEPPKPKPPSEEDLLGLASEPTKPKPTTDDELLTLADLAPTTSAPTPAKPTSQVPTPKKKLELPKPPPEPIALEPADEEEESAAELSPSGFPDGLVPLPREESWPDLGAEISARPNPFQSPSAASYGSKPAYQAPTYDDRRRTGLPWDREYSLDTFNSTFSLLMNEPEQAFDRMYVSGGFLSAYLFYIFLNVPLVMIGLVFYGFMSVNRLGADAAAAALVFMVPAQIVGALVGPFIGSAILYLATIMTFARNRGYPAIFTSYCYTITVAVPFTLIPVAGAFIALFMIVNRLSIAYRRIHGISGGRFALIMLLFFIAPFIICCCICCGPWNLLPFGPSRFQSFPPSGPQPFPPPRF